MLRELLAVAARAALEWAMASLLLANGAAYCLIAAAAARLRLGPPCILCARVHRLLCSGSASASEGRELDALRLILCDAHLAAVERQADDHDCRDRAAGKGGLTEADDVDPEHRGMETHRVVSIGSEICEQDHNDEQHHTTVARTSSSEDGGSGALVSLFELAPFISHPRDGTAGDSTSMDPSTTTSPELVTMDDGERLTVGQILSTLHEQRLELDALRSELTSERRARAEAEEYQRQLEEQGELDREAARLAMQLVHESESEKHSLQRQLDAWRVKAQLYHQSAESAAAMEEDGEGERREVNGGGDDGNNYQSLVDFLPGSVYSSSPDLANLLKLYTEAGNGGGRRQRDCLDGLGGEVVEEEDEEEEVVDVTVKDATESSGSGDATNAVVVSEPESLHEGITSSCHNETAAEAA